LLLCPDQSLAGKLENTDVPPSNRYSIKLGGNYEKKVPEDADMKPPEGLFQPFGAFLNFDSHRTKSI
jgi:hypothetical protein